MARGEADVVVVGAGATGLAASIALGEAGRSVLLLDAGPKVDPRQNFPRRAAEIAGGAAPAGRKTFPWSHPYTQHLFVDEDEHPWTTPEGRPFRWIRGRQVGGRLHTWGRVCLRMTDRQ